MTVRIYLLLGLTCSAMPCFAQPNASGPLSGSVSLGVRSVDVSGTPAKFREDVNLDDGVRLLNADFSYIPANGSDQAIDRMELQANNLGGDPFESVHFGARKYGVYNLKLDHRRSEYYYEDTILPVALASVSGSTGGDFHRFDFVRVRDSAALDIHISPATQLMLGLQHQTRSGDSTTTLDIARDEFEFERPLDESLNTLNIGLRHAFENVTIIFDEQLGQFENASELFLPGASAGQNVTDLAELQFFRLDQSYDYDSRGHTLTVLADPSSRLNIKTSVHREDIELDMRAREESLGTDFSGAPLVTATSGPARVQRELGHASVDVAYSLGERVRLIGGVRSSSLDQDGGIVFGLDQGTGQTQIDTDGYEIGVEFAIRSNVIVATGWSTESRDAWFGHSLGASVASENRSTDRDGYFARLLYRADSGLEVTVSLEDNSIDQPFTLATPSASQRYKFRLRQRWSNGIAFVGSHRRTDVENDTSGWLADTEQTDLSISYSKAGLSVSAGLGAVDVAREISQLVTAGTRQDLFSIAYQADSTFGNVSASWSLNDRYTVGGDIRTYQNRGSYSLDRDDLRAFLRVALTDRYELQVNYRNLDYTEDQFDAYDASIVELALGLKL